MGSMRLTLSILKQQIPDASAGVRVNASGGLVQDHHFCSPHKGQGHRQLPLHAPGQSAGSGTAFVLQPRVLQDVLDLTFHLLLRQTFESGVEPNVLFHCQPAGGAQTQTN